MSAASTKPPRLMIDGQPVVRIESTGEENYGLTVADIDGRREVQKSAILFWAVTAGPPERYWPITQSGEVSVATLRSNGRVSFVGQRLHRAYADWCRAAGVEVTDD
jgi:hypothetical protein